jgi:hypothetical protein
LGDETEEAKNLEELNMLEEDFKYLLEQALDNNGCKITARLLSGMYTRYHSSQFILPLLPTDIDHACSQEVMRFFSRRFCINDEGVRSHPLALGVVEARDRFKFLKEIWRRGHLLHDIIKLIGLMMLHSYNI